MRSPTPRPTPVRYTPRVMRISLPLMLLSSAPEVEKSLLGLVASDGSRGAILNAFEALEAAEPAPEDILLTDAGKTLLNGRWSLLGSITARVGDDPLDESGISNSVNASGLVIDADTSKKPVQQIDFARGRIGNEIKANLPLLGSAIVRVAGSLDSDASKGRRAYVEFDSLEVFRENDSGGMNRVLSAGFLFSLIRKVRPALTNGADEGSWLDTTYANERVRLGRGNKGSIFILSKADDGDGPLAEFPM